MAGSIAGIVSSQYSRYPIDGATTTTQPGGGTATTGSDGMYSISLAEGTYALTITATGYESFIADGLVVLDGTATEINVVLRPSDY